MQRFPRSWHQSDLRGEAIPAYDHLERSMLEKAYGAELLPTAELHDLLWQLESLVAHRLRPAVNYKAVSPGTIADSSRRGSIRILRGSSTADAPKIERNHIEAWRSTPRYGKHLETADGDDNAAFGLYPWDTGLAQLEPEACSYAYGEAEARCSVGRYLAKSPASYPVFV